MMTRPSEDDAREPTLNELLDADRDLTREEMNRLRVAGEEAWADVTEILVQGSRLTYRVASEEELRQCIQNHLDSTERIVMANAEAYHCWVCGRLLKDRNSPVASSILVERSRLAALFTDAETQPPGPERRRLWQRFRAALGLKP